MIAKKLLISFGCAVLLLALYAWPLIRHFSDGIPYTSVTSETPAARHMVMGDHLQLLYHFWLMADWMTGDTPWGYNPYLFNEGDDATTACPVTDYWPFSALFGLFHLVFGRAASWNLTILIVLWLSHFFLARWLRLYGATEFQANTLALVGVGIPYQWTALFGGSPTGFAMLAVPLVLYGFERAVRQASLTGGLLAAVGLLSAFWTDAHVLLFLMLLVPAWGVLLLIHEETFPWRAPRDWICRAVAVAPLALTAVTAAVLRMRTKSGLGDTIVGAGRDFHEVAIFSPRKIGLIYWNTTGHDHTIYLGALLILLMAAGVFYLAYTAFKERRWRILIHLALLAIGFAAIVAFALGTHGPRDAFVLRTAREWIPPISMIRQPAKIFGIVFPLAALLALPAWRLLAGSGSRPPWRVALPVVLALVLALDMGAQIRPGIGLLGDSQGAYAAVANDADRPHALVLPIWPGDSAWSSLYQHNASLYRVRLINGYLPVVQRAYIETVYRTLESVNTGHLTDAQIDFLAERGIHYILLHQNAFPEQVSWFPVGATLKKLLHHPRLTLLAQDGPVWAFRIADNPDPDAAASATSTWTLFGSRIQSEMEHERLIDGANVLADESASNGHVVRLDAPGQAVSMGDFNHQETAQPVLMALMRGDGTGRFMVANQEEETSEPFRVEADSWTWSSHPMIWSPGTRTIRPSFHLEEGQLDIDRVAYLDGHPPALQPGESYLIPAATLYHAGYTDIDANAVVFRAAHEPNGRILYGPRWPVPSGEYTAEIVWAEPPPSGVSPGDFEVRLGFHHVANRITLSGGEGDVLSFSTHDINWPLEFGFYYSRAADVSIRGIRITRTK